MSIRIAPSILSADFTRLAEAVHTVERGGADLVHVDVMDGHFVPNITIGQPVVKALARIAKVPLDVHLMIEAPDRYLEEFVANGAAMVTVHAEVLPHLHRTLSRIRELGARAGVAINPSTPVSAIKDVAGVFDHLLVMSVNPGFGGQQFIEHSVAKVAEARAMLDARRLSTPIEVDGGVDTTNIRALVDAGASIFVAGHSVFGTTDPAEAVRQLRASAEQPQLR
ncbi:MAG TPA: ribulose-phosphate 3-epimerase [Vicinamibacterales bacterium]|nr:ribulose-phosphate 3-epimerase [Vicinamibacterales bacterium]